MDTQIELAPGPSGDVTEGTSAGAPPRVVLLRGELSDACAADLVVRLGDLVRAHGRVVADVAALRLAHPGAVHAFADAAVRAGEWPDARLVLVGADRVLAAALAADGVDQAVPVHPDVTAALAHLDERPALTRAFWHLAVSPRAPGTARGHVRRVCRRWDVDDEVREAAEIVVTELVTNAVEHALSASVVHVERRDASFRLTVRDFDLTALPDARLPDPTAARGRGLAMVAAVAQAWGVDTHRDGKTVWAEMAIRP